MSAYFDPNQISEIKHFQLVIDNNILTSCFSNVVYLNEFHQIFKNNLLLLDPTVRLEFLRTTVTSELIQKKNDFLTFNNFYLMTDHSEIHKNFLEKAYSIARIYSQIGNPNIPLADLLIISRLSNYRNNVLFLTQDKSDFTTILFDIVSVVSIEKISKKNHRVLEHLVLLSFNNKKYKECLSKLP